MSYGNPLVAGIVGAVASLGTGIANAFATGSTNRAQTQQAQYSLAAMNRQSNAVQTVAQYEYQTALLNAQLQRDQEKMGLEKSKQIQPLILGIVAVGLVAGTVTLIFLARSR